MNPHQQKCFHPKVDKGLDNHRRGSSICNPMLTTVRLWILLSTLLVGSGWVLSALHALNRLGYLAAFAIFGIALAWGLPKTGWFPPESAGRLARKLRRRFRRPAPLLFLGLAFMCLLGGALYTPINGDSIEYRIPRVLHWLGHEQWHWIRGLDIRFNMAGCNFEWLSAPLILFTRTDRWIYLINWISFLLLPGLIFSVFTHLQVRPRVAWWWMWILSSGWCYAMQASSTVNDFFAVVYALASVALALRARESGSVGDAWLSMLAAALVTGVKQTDVPLALLWVIAILPGWKLLLKCPLAGVTVAATSLLVSIAPIAIFNFQHYHNWGGFPPNYPWKVMRPLDSPFWGIIGNAFCIPIQNLAPPVFPGANQWNAAMKRFVQTPFGSHFQSFENFGVIGPDIHHASEATAGLGLGICVLIMISLLAVWWIKRKNSFMVNSPPADRTAQWLRLAPFGLLLLFMAKVGTNQNARHLSAYYPFFFPVILASFGHTILVRRRWWQNLSLSLLLFTGMLLLVSPDRPLFPAEWIISRLETAYPNSMIVKKEALSFSARLNGEEVKYHFSGKLPPDENTVGYAAGFEAGETGLWLPLTNRKVERLLPTDTKEDLNSLGIHYLVMEEHFTDPAGQNLGKWLEQHHGVVLDTYVQAVNPEYPWRTHSWQSYLIKINP
jgi:hypothetical protein